MWALSYIAVAILCPTVSGLGQLESVVFYMVIGWALIIALLLRWWEKDNRFYKPVANIILFVLGIFEVFGGVASWTGVSLWNVPFENIAAFQISMAFADLLSAVMMFALAIGGERDEFK